MLIPPLIYLFSQLTECFKILFFLPVVAGYPGPREDEAEDISTAILFNFLFLRNTLNKPLDRLVVGRTGEKFSFIESESITGNIEDNL
uniref:Putative secreted protein n=1 Tax=Panstrongylus lignarius TaxID=156445 RepID=A0A224Y3Q5_9HEMI